MTNTVTATGFESAFIKTWNGWDQQDTLVLQFYNCDMTDSFAEATGLSEADCVAVDLESMKIEVYDDNGNVVIRKDLQISLK